MTWKIVAGFVVGFVVGIVSGRRYRREPPDIWRPASGPMPANDYDDRIRTTLNPRAATVRIARTNPERGQS